MKKGAHQEGYSDTTRLFGYLLMVLGFLVAEFLGMAASETGIKIGALVFVLGIALAIYGEVRRFKMRKIIAQRRRQTVWTPKTSRRGFFESSPCSSCWPSARYSPLFYRY